MATRKVATIVLALLLLSALPAGAGAEEDPEVTDSCGGLPPVMEESDICTAWFEGQWEVAPEADGIERAVFAGLNTMVTIAADISQPPEYVTYSMGWKVESCRLWWVSHFLADANERRTTLHSECPGMERISTDLAEGHVSFGVDRISVRLMMDEELSPVADLFFKGQEITEPVVRTWFAARSETGQPLGATVEADWTAPGRTFVIGQDRPEGTE